tara:strand:+ start:6282 stop:8288 length:2007 start_codon:yes stop_codon:yes gene_type:complete
MAIDQQRPKDINFLNKDFTGLRSDLIDFAKTYFPASYSDFNETSPGMMFIEMAAYVGDILSFYIDEQFRESLLAYAEERKTVFDIAQSYGYKPKISTPANVTVDFFQTVPAKGTGDNVTPNYDYGHRIKEGTVVSADQYGKTFRTVSEVDFSTSGSLDPVTVSIYEVNPSTATPTKYLLKKQARAVSGEVVTEQFTFTSAKAYDMLTLGNNNVLEIISVTDSDGNKWYQVESLAQDLVYEEVRNDAEFDPNLAGFNDTTPYMIKLLRTKKRYKSYIKSDGSYQLRFGSGTATQNDEEVIPNPSTVGNSNVNSDFLNTNSALDPANFLETAVYGVAPSNTTLTIKYSIGGGVDDNVPSNSISSLRSLTAEINNNGLDSDLVTESADSISVNNPGPATGGKGAETIDEIKENVKQYFQAQSRAVTKEDYITRIYSLPAKYGNVAKVYITQDDQLNSGEGVIQGDVLTPEVLMEEFVDKGESLKVSDLEVRVPNPMALNFYVLGYNNSKQLVNVNEATKRNIKTYMGQYRILTDAINLKNAYVINIGVRFTIYAKRGYNKEEVIFKCIQKVKEYFNVDKWQINQPIMLADVAYQISLVDGVNSVVPPVQDNPDGNLIVITNKFETASGYSGNLFDITTAIRNGIVYPSLDPSIFEVKFPDIDIVGKCLGDY